MLPEPTVERRDTDAPKGLPRQRRSLAVVFFGTTEQRVEAVAIAVLILAGLGYWTYTGVKRSLEEVRSASLRAVLESKVDALRVWAGTKRAEAERWAADPEVVEAVRRLEALSRAGATREALWASPARVQFVNTLAPFFVDRDSVAINAVERDGRILATRVEGHIGARVGPSVLADLAPVFRGETRFISPRPERERIPEVGKSAYDRPIAWFAAPVRASDGRIIAALELGLYADTRFAGLFGLGWLTESESTVEGYAFDESGLLLTKARYFLQLRDAGLLPPGATTAAFNVRLRDPGVDLMHGERPPADLDARRFTPLVERAIASRSDADPRAHEGVLLEPYRNYAGLEVIGAWRWLPEYDMGIAVEVSRDEAYAPIRYLTVAFQVVFAMLVIAVAAALGSTFSVARLRREERQLGVYRLEGKIDEGGMATVHRAVHGLLRRPTALKILKPHLATDELIARFEREVQLASRLEHPATIEIFDYGRTRDGTFFYAMEYIDGLTLAKLVEHDGAQAVPRVAHILKQVCESLREAHGKGLIHRDIKPANVMLCERGGESDVVKVLDFGLIKDVRATDTRDITQYARLLGTPTYMAPERIRNPAAAAPTVDVYAVGALAFYLLTGRRVFDAPNELELARRVLEDAAPRVSSAAKQSIPKAIDELVARTLAKDPADRPQRVEELLAVFTAVLQAHPWTQEAAARWWHDFRGGQEAAMV
ncbi:MAG TPA: serine/threonine-protein kinase [Burkholderiales bacterium]|nr:serine/threonine-protein kinase [Burkholderiales bacterium]